MNPIHSRAATGPSPAQEATQAQRSVTEPAQRQTHARFATSQRNNVRFAHAHHAHRQGQARSANARRLAQALAKKRQGKAATARFAAARRPAATRPGANARAAQGTRSADRPKTAQQRITRDGGNGGSRGGGQPQGEQQQRQRRDERARDGDFAAGDIGGVNRAAAVAPEFAAHALTLTGTSRRDALANAWCDALLEPRASLHHAMAQLRTLRGREGPLPLATLAQVRQSLMDATARVATRIGAHPPADPAAAPITARPNSAKQARHALAPLLALVAGGPLLAARERRAVSANAALAGVARARTLRTDDANDKGESSAAAPSAT
jgi:hypothetical protein